MMNETTTTWCDLPEQLQQFADLFIERIKSKHKIYVRDCEKLGQDIPLECISVGIEDFTAAPGEIPGINLHDKAELIVSGLLWALCNAGLIEPADNGRYKLTKHRSLHKRLKEKLVGTP